MSNPPFMSENNKAMLQRVLYNDITRRMGNDLTEKQAQRLVKTVDHYMSEVNRVESGNMGVKDMNREVLKLTVPDYMSYLERKQRSSARSVMSDMEEGPSLPGQQQINGLIEDKTPPRTQMDVSNAFAQLQSQRQEQRKTVPPQDFRLQLKDEGTVSLDVFERLKQEREEEAKRTALLQQQQQASNSGQQRYADATDFFSRDKRRADEEAEQVFADRERARLEQRVQAGSQLALPPPPDMRALFMGDKTQIGRTMNQAQPNSAAGNSTIAQPNVPFVRETTGQQLIITREPDLIAYKETELNLFVYSGDRDWANNSQETRYSFSVSFDPSNLPTGLRLAPTSTVKFRNITKVELVKAIMPGEGLDMLVTKPTSDTYSAAVNMNILSYPYIQVRIPELETNNYGTNQSLNAAFGVLQYDANWIYDTSNSATRGYFAMIPKFLKCQKVYTPTPLSTLQRLTFRFERPDGNVLSQIPDTLDIKQIIPTFAMTAGVMTAGGALTNTVYQNDGAVDISGSAYYWLQTKTFFNHWTVSTGDRITMKNLTWDSDPTGSAVTQLQDTLTYLQQEGGLLVVGTGVITGTDPTTWIFADGYNKQGYANAILVRGKFIDPAVSGGLFPVAPGGIDDQVSSGYLSDFLINTAVSKGRLLNQSHQVQVTLRVIVREMDSTGFIRPDNL